MGQSPLNDTRSSLLKYATVCLNRQPYFRNRLRDKLIQRAKKLSFCDAYDTIDEILFDLSKSGYLNDQVLANGYVRRQLSKGYGPKIIFLKLLRLNLEKDKISLAIEEEATPEAQLETISKLKAKYSKYDRYKLTAKLYGRGFSSSIINKAFDVGAFED
jgi:SOS response regulatory protein OraA/RecX